MRGWSSDSISKNPTSQNDLMLATQFPLKLSFACTAHKIQGSTITDPNKVILDLRSVKEPAMGYVMFSRPQRIDQVFIFEKFESSKIFPSESAMEELERLKVEALNEKEKGRIEGTVIQSLNIRSLMKHHAALRNDSRVKAKVIALQETWCNLEQTASSLEIPGYSLHLLSCGRGKGIATYFTDEFQVTGAINRNNYQISKVSSANFDVINVYCSQSLNKAEFLRDLGSLAGPLRTGFIVGDFNIDFFQDQKDAIVSKILSRGFQQLVDHPTHMEGGLLDHVYHKGLSWEPKVDLQFPYYTDHSLISVSGQET